MNTDTPSGLAAAIRAQCAGEVEWRVACPTTGAYCMAFNWSGSGGAVESTNPERDAREWLADYRRRNPSGRHADYEVKRAEVRTELQSLASRAADMLEALPAHAASMAASTMGQVNHGSAR